MVRIERRFFSLRVLTGFFLLGAFLLLGFCPLRNTLLAIAHPAAAAPKVPVYSKIVGQDDCVTAVIQKALPTSGKKLVPPVQTAWLTANSFALSSWPVKVIDRSSVTVLARVNLNFPIYLLNRCLLI